MRTRMWMGTIVAILCCGCAATSSMPRSHLQLNVKNVGAVGDGKTVDTAAFQKALDQCGAAGGGEIVVPAGDYLIGSLVMPSHITLRLEKGATLIGSADPLDYPLVDVRWEGRWRQGHRALIHAKNAEQIAIVGAGTINGDMNVGDLREPRGPCIFEPIECKDVRIEGIHVNYRRMWAIHLTYCQNVLAKDLTIRSTRANGDGIDVDSSREVRIDDCDIDTGDDAIALKSGRGMEGVRIGRPTENVTISNCRLGSAFAGVALGTEMSGGIRHIRIDHCTFTRGSNSIFVKSRSDRGGFMEDIEGHDLTVAGAKCFLRFDLLERGLKDSEPVPGLEGIARVGNIRMSNVKVDTDFLIDARATSPDKPVQGLSVANVTGTCRRGIVLNNVKDVDLRDIQVSGFSGPLVTATNVTGKGTENAQLPRKTSG